MRVFAAIVALCTAVILSGPAAQARPSPYPPVTQFNGDRYEAQAHLGPEVVRAVKAKQGAKPRYLYPTRKRLPVVRQNWRGTRMPAARPVAYEPYRVEAPLSVLEGVKREAGRAAEEIAPTSRFIAGRLICARNVNAALAARGIKGTGSALARSFLAWGRSSGPVPGAVAIYSRGSDSRNGHAAIVAFVKNGVPYVWNPSRHGWRLQAYHKQAISYRVPS